MDDNNRVCACENYSKDFCLKLMVDGSIVLMEVQNMKRY